MPGNGASVHQVIDDLEERFPGIKDRLCDGDELKPGLTVAVDTQVASLGLRQSVSEDIEIQILPEIGGG